MSAATRAGRAWPFAVVAVAVVTVAVLQGSGREGRPFDPTSTGELGLKGVVDVLEALGADVETTDVVAGADTVLMARDGLSDEQRRELLARVEQGIRLVVADPSSPVVPVRSTDVVHDGGLLLDCPLAALRGAQRMSAPVELLAVPDDGEVESCYRGGEGAWLLVFPRGEGAVVALGSITPFVNAELAQADHAVIAAGLLAPTGSERVVVLAPKGPGGGEKGLVDLVSDGVKAGLWQLGVAFLVFAWWRARRHGEPVSEPVPVEVEARAVVSADAGLRQRGGVAAPAAARIVDAARHELATLVGLSSEAGDEAIADAVARRTGLDADRIRAALVVPPRLDDAGLLASARTIGAVREEVRRALV